MENSTEVTEFILLGLTNDHNVQVPLFLVFLFISSLWWGRGDAGDHALRLLLPHASVLLPLQPLLCRLGLLVSHSS